MEKKFIVQIISEKSCEKNAGLRLWKGFRPRN